MPACPLTAEERDTIFVMIRENPHVTFAEIARRTCRHRSTISREVTRHGGKVLYRPATAGVARAVAVRSRPVLEVVRGSEGVGRRGVGALWARGPQLHRVRARPDGADVDPRPHRRAARRQVHGDRDSTTGWHGGQSTHGRCSNAGVGAVAPDGAARATRPVGSRWSTRAHPNIRTTRHVAPLRLRPRRSARRSTGPSTTERPTSNPRTASGPNDDAATPTTVTNGPHAARLVSTCSGYRRTARLRGIRPCRPVGS